MSIDSILLHKYIVVIRVWRKSMINIKLNRGLYSEEEFDDLERLMATYSLCQSKRSGKTFLIATKCKKHTWWYCVYAFIIPLCIGFIMLIPINKWICLLLGIAAASAFVGGLSVMHRNTLKKLQFHICFLLVKCLSIYHTICNNITRKLPVIIWTNTAWQ